MKFPKLLTLAIAFMASNCLSAQYCMPSANCAFGDGVTLMSIGPFSNSSGCESDNGVSGYADFTDISGFFLGQGVTYEGQFLSGFPSQQFSIWIDSDLSNSFESSELIMTDLAVGTELVTTDVTIPVDIPIGEYRLRIKANYFAPSSGDPCLSTTYGECEDYTVIITEPPSCINVSGLEVTSLSATSATIAWVDPGTATVWDVEWGLAGFEPTGFPSPGYDDTDNPAVLNDLNPVTEYDVYIRADCGMDNETDISVWTSGFSFITACGAVQPTYLEDFNGGLGACWEVFGEGDLDTGPIDGGFPNWFDNGFANTPNVFSGSQAISIFDVGIQNWLVSPDIDLTTDGPYQLEFDISITAPFNQSSALLDDNDEVRLLISTDFGGSWATLDIWDDEETVEISGEHLVYDLSAYEGEIVRLAYWVSSGTVGSFSSFQTFVDNFLVQPLGSPMNVEIDQIVEPDCFFFGNPLADVLINISGGFFPYTFEWSNGSETEDLIDVEAGIYTLTVTDSEGNVFISDPIDVPGTPVLTVTAIVTDETYDGFNDGSIEITGVEGGDGNYFFFWNNGATSQTITGLIDALWCVEITDGAGCSSDTCFEVFQGLPPTGILEFETSLALSIFPNPSVNGTSQIQADLSSGKHWEIVIIDPIGRVIQRRQVQGGSYYSNTLDLAGYSEGLYSIRVIRMDDGKAVNKILIR